MDNYTELKWTSYIKAVITIPADDLGNRTYCLVCC